MQPQIGVTLALCKGTSIITESIFENRFKYLDELARMGGVSKIEGNSATIEGVEKFTGAESAHRTCAQERHFASPAWLRKDTPWWTTSSISRERYERFEEKLRSLGGVIEKVSSEKEMQKFKVKSRDNVENFNWGRGIFENPPSPN